MEDEKILSQLSALGIDMESITPEKIEALNDILQGIDDPRHATQEQLKQILGLVGRKKALKSEKIGRNAKCPCNSGKKYKKCCWKP